MENIAVTAAVCARNVIDKPNFAREIGLENIIKIDILFSDS